MGSLSNREKVLLLIFVVVVIFYCFYTYVYEKQMRELTQLKTAVEEAQFPKMNSVEDWKKGVEKRQAEILSLEGRIKEDTKHIFPVILQDKIVLILNDMLKTTGIVEASMSFSTITASEVIQVESTGGRVAVTPDNYLDEYVANGYVMKEPDKEDTIPSDETLPKYKPGEEYQVYKMITALSFSSSYDQLVNLLERIKQNEHTIVMDRVSVSLSQNGLLSCSVDLAFYALPPLFTPEGDYLEWTIINPYGVENPFGQLGGGVQPQISSEGKPLDSVSSLVADSQTTESYDFIVLAKPEVSDAPALLVGRGKDSTAESYISTESGGAMPATITLTASGGKYYFTYTVGNARYPTTGTKEFSPFNSDEILVKIFSTERLGDADVNKVNLSVVNQTNLNARVIVSNEDANRPRVAITRTGSVSIE